jgi:hypothetical protein
MRVVLGQFSGHDVLSCYRGVPRISRDSNIRHAARPELLYGHIIQVRQRFVQASYRGVDFGRNSRQFVVFSRHPLLRCFDLPTLRSSAYIK